MTNHRPDFDPESPLWKTPDTDTSKADDITRHSRIPDYPTPDSYTPDHETAADQPPTSRTSRFQAKRFQAPDSQEPDISIYASASGGRGLGTSVPSEDVYNESGVESQYFPQQHSPKHSRFDAPTGNTQPSSFNQPHETAQPTSATPRQPIEMTSATQPPRPAQTAPSMRPPTPESRQERNSEPGRSETQPEKKNAKADKRRTGVSWPAALVLMLFAVALSMTGSWFVMKEVQEAQKLATLGSSGQVVATQAPVVAQNPVKETHWETVAKTVRPSVVAISVQAEGTVDTGSGVIFTEQGNVLTNYHVVSNASVPGAELIIQLFDGRLYYGEVVGGDPTTDLAVLKILNPPSDMRMVTLGQSDNLQVGQPVAAIGAPLGLNSTMTTGIISAIDRPVTVNQKKTPGENTFGDSNTKGKVLVTTNAIQVDAAINPGNSGGPLFAADGTVIGINSSIAALSSEDAGKGSIGIGFSIPINLAKKIANQILDDGKVRHAFLGVRVLDGVATVGNTTRSGAKIVDVEPNHSAAQAGIRPGDIITKLNDHQVVSGAALTGYVRWYLPQDKVKLTVIRGGEELVLDATLGATEN